jgi:hypothetical protein
VWPSLSSLLSPCLIPLPIQVPFVSYIACALLFHVTLDIHIYIMMTQPVMTRADLTESKCPCGAGETAAPVPHNIHSITKLEPSRRDPNTNDFNSLVTALRTRLGPSSGITDDDVDPDELQSLMTAYVSKESDWAKYAFKAPSKLYTRNLVDKGNGKSNLVSSAMASTTLILIKEAHPRLVPRERQPSPRVSNYSPSMGQLSNCCKTKILPPVNPCSYLRMLLCD